jgi:hypothetical protein
VCQAMKNALDCTINDVMVGVVTGMWRRYLEYRQEPALKGKLQVGNLFVLLLHFFCVLRVRPSFLIFFCWSYHFIFVSSLSPSCHKIPLFVAVCQVRALIPYSFPRSFSTDDTNALRNLWCFLSLPLPINVPANQPGIFISNAPWTRHQSSRCFIIVFCHKVDHGDDGILIILTSF